MICMRSFFQISHVSSGFDCLLTLSHGMAVAQDLVKKKMTFTETFENAFRSRDEPAFVHNVIYG